MKNPFSPEGHGIVDAVWRKEGRCVPVIESSIVSGDTDSDTTGLAPKEFR